MANVSEIVMIVRACTHNHHHVLKLTQLHLDIIFWLARGFTYNDLVCRLGYSYSHIHNSLVWLYDNTKTCNEASLVSWAHLSKVLVEKNGKAELNEELMLKKESG